MSMVSKFMANPSRSHSEAFKWILKYIKGSNYLSLIFSRQSNSKDFVTSFVDSDYAGSIDTRKSLTVFVFTMFGTAISWKANLQSVVALSTTKAEYIVVTEAINDTLWIIGMIKEHGIHKEKNTVFCDNQSTIHLTRNQVLNERSKHIDIKLHFVRDVVHKGLVGGENSNRR
ncbi:hypothetical protein ACP275_08G099900 [Erythranthe tilingii]